MLLIIGVISEYYCTSENIVMYFGEQRIGVKRFLVMQFCNGGCLSELLFGNKLQKDTNIALYSKVVVGFIIDIVKGMKVIHSTNHVHLDLKSQNLMLTVSEFGELLIKITDFGVSKLAGSTIRGPVGTYNTCLLYTSPSPRD